MKKIFTYFCVAVYNCCQPNSIIFYIKPPTVDGHSVLHIKNNGHDFTI